MSRESQGTGGSAAGPARGRRGRKSKPLRFVAGVCPERQWADPLRAAYPLLLRLGFFDPPAEEARDRPDASGPCGAPGGVP